ncbi:MAG: hypothetical protein HYV46_17575 [candidate division NC10 bacterium]|nr:hypothetical protein [candidate division NC10 bacterium]
MDQPPPTTDDTGREPPGFRVREATPQDNVALLALDRQCVVAAATPVAFDRSPDFFARSRPYSRWRAYVAMEGNVASLTFVQGRGSSPLRPCALALIPVEAVPAADTQRLRGLENSDIEAALRLARTTHTDHDLFPFPDAGSLRDRLERLGGAGFRGLYGWESGGEISGCFGLWDYSPVMRMRILQAEGEWAWAGERDLHQVFLMPLGFRGVAGGAEAVRLAAALLRRESGPGAARVLAVPHDLADAAYAGLDEFRPIRLGFKMFGLELGGARGPSLGSRPVFVDPADL